MARSSQPPLPSVVRPIGDDGRKAYTGNPVDHKGTVSLKQIQPRKRELVERQNTDDDILNDMEVYTTES